MALAILAGGLYAVTLYPSAGYGDSGELIAAAYGLGVNHSPSNPLYILAASAFGHLLPAGEFAWRVNLLSALVAAATAVVFFLSSVRIFGLSPSRAFLLSAALAVTPAFWGQATVAEVYLPAALLAALLLAAIAGGEAGPRAPLLFLAAGAGMGIHYSSAFLLPPLLWWLLRGSGKGRLRALAASTILYLLGFSVMGYVWFRAGKSPNVDFGHLNSAGDFLRHIFRARYEFRSSLPRGAGLLLSQFLWVWMIVLKETHIVALVALAGARRLSRKNNYPFLLFGPLFAMAMTVLFNYPSFAIADSMAHQKLLPMVFWIYLLAAAGCGSLQARRLAVPVATAALLLNVWFSWPGNDNSSNRVSLAWAEGLLRSLPEGKSLLFVEGDIDIMPLLYLKEVKGRAPQTEVIDRDGLYFSSPYRYDDYPPQIHDEVRRRTEAELIASFDGPVYYSHYPGGPAGDAAVPRGLLFEVKGKMGAGERGVVPTVLPEDLLPHLENPDGLEYRERDVLSRFLARQSALAGPEKKEELLRRSAAISPLNPIHLTRLASFLDSTGRAEEALFLYERVYMIAWHYEPALAGYVQALVRAGSLEKAIEVTERFLSLDPENPYTLGNLALLKRATGSTGEAGRLEREAQERREERERLLREHFPLPIPVGVETLRQGRSIEK